ncbi:MAG: acyl-CoA dehydrogenase family protein [candidate division WOR-3 bacterium]|nr:acyl-CoA dehydrogenase family protein [candidate division WOR-3 bacterium]MCX7948142.1 acyl-CoA dehydrogenase family protein [candidate division WOR-3 bacterium]MDW8151049.1 acyl-CoA dehydrogenase family protein [candidate division WOR-3 bacterium]
MLKYEDFFLLDEKLSSEYKVLRESVRKFVDNEVIPIISEYWENGKFPRRLISKIAELGLVGSYMPVEYGGGGFDKLAYGIITRELERGDSGIRSFVSVQTSLVMYPILTFGSENQRKKYLPKLASCEVIGCFGLTEPDAGSDPSSMKTRAYRKGNKWILRGTKMWITNANISDIAIIWAKDDDNIIRGFIVERDMGYKTKEMKGKISLRASDTGEVILDDVEVPEENRLPFAEGLKAPLMCLNQARFGIAWGAVGIAQFCLETALKYSKERIMFSNPIASYQLTQQKLADILTYTQNANLIAYRIAELEKEGKLSHYHISYAKRYNVRAAKVVSEMARSILGANGIMLDYHIMRHMTNLEAVETYEGTYEIHTLILGEFLTGMESFRK